MCKSEEPTVDVETLKPKETWRIVKNVVVISVAFMVQFTAYGGAANLQSSINAEAGLGTASLAAVYAGLIISSLFLPVVILKWVDPKWALSLSLITYMPYIAAQLMPNFYTLIPTGILVGLGGGPLWAAQGTYLAVVAEAHSKISKISSDALMVRFFGLFFMIFQMNQVWGNLISSLVLSSSDNIAAVTSLNASMIPELCGANFLPTADAEEVLLPQPPEKIQMIVGIYLACMAGAALIVAVGVDPAKRYESSSKADIGSSAIALLSATLKLLIEPKQMLLIAINIFIGYQQAFIGADFNAAFVSCAVGTGAVGFVMTTYGLSDAIGCLLTGYLAKLTGRLPLMCVATVVHTGIFAALLLYPPQADTGYVLYVYAVLWGLCDSIWVVQINAYYGILFPGREVAAFANFRLWESIGYIVVYIISPYLRTSAKIYVMLVLMVLGVFCYLIVEVQERRSKRTFEINVEIKKKIKTGCDNVGFHSE